MVSAEMKKKIGLYKSAAANDREIWKQSLSPYKRYVKRLPHGKNFMTPMQHEPSPCTQCW